MLLITSLVFNYFTLYHRKILPFIVGFSKGIVFGIHQEVCLKAGLTVYASDSGDPESSVTPYKYYMYHPHFFLIFLIFHFLKKHLDFLFWTSTADHEYIT